MSGDKVLFVLDCEHIMLANAFGSETVRCGECGGMKKVEDVHVYEWHFKCNMRTCPVGKWCGLSRTLAIYVASQHVKRHANHNPIVEYARNPVAVRVQDRLKRNGVIS